MTQLSAYVFSMHVFGIYFHPAFFFFIYATYQNAHKNRWIENCFVN